MVAPYNPFFRAKQANEIAREAQRTDNMRIQQENNRRYEAEQAQAKQAQDTQLTGRLARGVLGASTEQKSAAYQNAIKIAGEQGIDLQGMPTTYTKEVDS